MTDRPSLPALERLVAAHRLPEALDMALRFSRPSRAARGASMAWSRARPIPTAAKRTLR